MQNTVSVPALKDLEKVRANLNKYSNKILFHQFKKSFYFC